jgi:hypothetical protein
MKQEILPFFGRLIINNGLHKLKLKYNKHLILS